jgi:hypothetical protein
MQGPAPAPNCATSRERIEAAVGAARRELNEAEQENIVRGQEWALGRR